MNMGVDPGARLDQAWIARIFLHEPEGEPGDGDGAEGSPPARKPMKVTRMYTSGFVRVTTP